MKFLTQRGFSFGLTSGIITTLGLMIGLYASTESKLVVLGGILTIAIADAFSDSLSMHISEESQNKKNPKEIWRSTVMTFFAKFFFALIFIIPILLIPLKISVILNIIIALVIITFYNYYIAKIEKKRISSVVGEHLMITVFVIIATFYAGKLIPLIFK
jgi:VIT1/CCC1 family predicted Fe2+/Mn2+ transporter